ncbi:glycoside hydrolase family 2 TIM barrel-domain containing protein [Sunxiuqinia indica]|uniref:glycoside hydrolase family 2 TIM barrel-domain containing protein n=1 Tax=Sunxiuqinia indica TaxID=2692584 RepID=UPI00135CE169|nr:glycoside hydrolase family 2 TIM barrel-domain containing protein [Sunxiuqinia indica]
MKTIPTLSILLILVQLSCQQKVAVEDNKQISFVAPTNTERMRLFDDNWRFAKTSNEDAISPDFDDQSWRVLDLPHDWSIEDLPEGEGVIGPFSKNSPGGVSTGFTIGGTGFYRKTFSVSPKDQGKIFTIYFDGVYMESDVWINGHHLGFHPNGYTPFYYNLTDYLKAPGEENVLVVRAKNIGENSRWYSGSGIYRHVWLRVTDPLNIPVWGVFVKTVGVDEKWATIDVSTTVQNQGEKVKTFVFRQEVVDAEGITLVEMQGKMPTDGSSLPMETSFEIENPELWSPEHPNLYTLRTEIREGDSLVDLVETRFGIRTLDFSPDNGFLLNGEPVILKGACLHHDNGILGAATFDRAEQRKVELMKANGFNAIRTSHNPPSQQFLDACDRLGILVMDEAFDRWEEPKKPDDYHRYFKQWSKKDIQSMVMRDRNHPSIFAWSYGNEIYERADSSGIRIAKELIRAIKEKDNTRPVTQAICGFWNHPGDRPWSDSAPAFELMDVHSYNYQWKQYENDHQLFPERVIIGSETFAVEAYENYKMALDKPYVIGDFVWTGMDYLGEAGIGQASLDSVQMAYPWFNGYCGDIDLLGFKKPQSYYRDVVWGRSGLEIAVEKPAPEGHQWEISKWGWRNELPSWNWSGFENHPMDVFVYSPAKKVTLMLNEVQVAEKFATDSSQYVFHFKVPYQPGELTAIAYNGDDELGRKTIQTTGKASQIALKAEREAIAANKNDLAYIEINILDENGRLVMDDDQKITFSVEGDAKIIAVGNGNPTDMKSFQSDSCMTYLGRCMAILRPGGKVGYVNVTAKSKSLKSDGIDVMIK